MPNDHATVPPPPGSVIAAPGLQVAYAALRAEHFTEGRDSILVVTRNLAEDGATQLALNLCAFLKRRHDVVLLALAGGPLLDVARRAATVVIALAAAGGDTGMSAHAAAAAFRPLYAIVNGILDARLLRSLARGGVPPVLLCHDGSATAAGAGVVESSCLTVAPREMAAGAVRPPGRGIAVLRPAISQIRWPVPDEQRHAEAMQARRDLRPDGERDGAFVVLVHAAADGDAHIPEFLRLARALARMPLPRRIRLAWHLSSPGERDAMEAVCRNDRAGGSTSVDLAVCARTAPDEAALDFIDAVLLLPAEDGVPMTALAALGRGVPVIPARRDSWMAEMLLSHPDLARCVPDADPDAVARVICALAGDPDGHAAAGHAARALAGRNLRMPDYVATLHRAAEAAAASWRAARPSRKAEEIDAPASHYAVLHAPHSSAPLVSVIIPVHGQFAFTHACIQSIIESPPRVPIEVVIVDDASTDETLDAADILKGCRVVRQDVNLGFIHSCNHGARVAGGQFLFFLNNDTTVHPGAIDALVETFGRYEDAGIVGAKLLFPDGRLQDAGGIVWREGEPWNYGRGEDPQEPRFNYVRPVDYASGAALMIRRELFGRLGGFDPLYAPAYYEDTDLAFRVRAAGYSVLYQPRAQVVHREGGTGGTDLTRGAKRHQVINAEKFRDRWRTSLQTHGSTGTEVDREKDRAARFRVLFIDETTPTPQQDAGSGAALTHMRCLQSLGAKVTFVPSDNMVHLGPPSTFLQDLGIEFIHLPHFWSVEEVLRKRPHEFDVIYLHRLNTALRYLSLCRALSPRARIVYNVADLHHLRLEREQMLRSTEFGDAGTARRARDAELLLARFSDIVIVHSSVEREILAGHGIENVLEVPWVVEGRPPDRQPGARAGLCFIGGFRHRPNCDAVTWFLDAVWPLVRQARPHETFGIVGSNMPPEIWALERHEGVRCHGFVEDIEPVLGATRLTVAPLRYGAGLKGKVALSLAHGVPCVGTAVAYEGFDGQQPELALIADTPDAMARRIVELLSDDALWSRASAAAFAYASRRFSRAAVTGILRSLVPRSLASS